MTNFALLNVKALYSRGVVLCLYILFVCILFGASLWPIDPFLTDRFYVAWIVDIKQAKNISDVILAGMYNLQAPEFIPSILLWIIDLLTAGILPPELMLLIPMFVIGGLVLVETPRLHWFSFGALVGLIFGYYGLILFNVTYRLAFAFMFFAAFLFLVKRQIRFADVFLYLAFFSHLSFVAAIPVLYFYFLTVRGENFLSIRFYLILIAMILTYTMGMSMFFVDSFGVAQLFNNKLNFVGLQFENISLMLCLLPLILHHLAVSFRRFLLPGLIIFLIGLFYMLGSSRIYMLLSLVSLFLYIFYPPIGRKKVLFAMLVVMPISMYGFLKVGYLFV